MKQPYARECHLRKLVPGVKARAGSQTNRHEVKNRAVYIAPVMPAIRLESNQAGVRQHNCPGRKGPKKHRVTVLKDSNGMSCP